MKYLLGIIEILFEKMPRKMKLLHVRVNMNLSINAINFYKM
jgi:hypothetical protein